MGILCMFFVTVMNEAGQRRKLRETLLVFQTNSNYVLGDYLKFKMTMTSLKITTGRMRFITVRSVRSESYLLEEFEPIIQGTGREATATQAEATHARVKAPKCKRQERVSGGRQVQRDRRARCEMGGEATWGQNINRVSFSHVIARLGSRILKSLRPVCGEWTGGVHDWRPRHRPRGAGQNTGQRGCRSQLNGASGSGKRRIFSICLV